jgi:hypothetical protein
MCLSNDETLPRWPPLESVLPQRIRSSTQARLFFGLMRRSRTSIGYGCKTPSELTGGNVGITKEEEPNLALS